MLLFAQQETFPEGNTGVCFAKHQSTSSFLNALQLLQEVRKAVDNLGFATAAVSDKKILLSSSQQKLAKEENRSIENWHGQGESQGKRILSKHLEIKADRISKKRKQVEGTELLRGKSAQFQTHVRSIP